MTGAVSTKALYTWGAAIIVLCLGAFAALPFGLPALAALAVPFVCLFAYLFYYNWKLTFWLLLVSIPPSVDLGYLDLPVSTSLPDEPISWVFTLMLLFLLARSPKALPKWWWRSPLVLIVVLQYLWLGVAVIYSKEPMLSVKFMAAKTWVLATFFILPYFIFKEKKDFILAFRLFFATLVATVLVVLFRHYKLHFDFMAISEAVSYIYYNRVEYSTVLTMFLPLMWVALPLSKKMHPAWRIGLLAANIIFLPAIYFSFARAALMAVIFAAAVGVIIRFRLVQWVMPAFYGLVALAATYMVRHNKYYEFRPNFNQTYTHTNFADHMVATFRGTDMSSMERLYRWVASVRMSAQRPLTGYGPNAFYYYYKPYAVTAFRTYVSRNPEMSTTHNYFLAMLVGQGWPAMLLYALLVMVVLVYAQRIYHRFKDKFYRSVTIGLAMLFAAGFINNFFSELIETHKVGALFYLCLSLLILLDRKSRTDPSCASSLIT